MKSSRGRVVAAALLVIACTVLLLMIIKARPAKAQMKETTTTASVTTQVSQSQATPTPTPAPGEKEVSSITDEKLREIYREYIGASFKDTSTKYRYKDRVAATKSNKETSTGINDAVTFDVKNIIDEIFRNPIYLSGVDLALREVKVIGQSDWSKKFHDSFTPVTTEWWEHWVEKGPDGTWRITDEYFLIAARYCCIVEGLQYYREVNKTKVVSHFPLNTEMEVCFKSTKQEKYPFWVYIIRFKDGRTILIGINKVDYRWAILKRVPTPTPKKNTPTPKKNTPTPSTSKKVTPTPKPKSKKNDPIHRNKDSGPAADIGSPSNPANHNNNTQKTPEPTSPKTYTKTVTPTPKPASKPTVKSTTKSTVVKGTAPLNDPG